MEVFLLPESARDCLNYLPFLLKLTIVCSAVQFCAVCIWVGFISLFSYSASVQSVHNSTFWVDRVEVVCLFRTLVVGTSTLELPEHQLVSIFALLNITTDFILIVWEIFAIHFVTLNFPAKKCMNIICRWSGVCGKKEHLNHNYQIHIVIKWI